MSIKIKVTWGDNNVVSEGVRIYRSNTKFTSSNLPAVLATLTTSNEYDDIDVVKGQIYFYMLSSFLGEQEAFTECFSVATRPWTLDDLLVLPQIKLLADRSVVLNANLVKQWNSVGSISGAMAGNNNQSGQPEYESLMNEPVIKFNSGRNLSSPAISLVAKNSTSKTWIFATVSADSNISAIRRFLNIPFDNTNVAISITLSSTGGMFAAGARRGVEVFGSVSDHFTAGVFAFLFKVNWLTNEVELIMNGLSVGKGNMVSNGAPVINGSARISGDINGSYPANGTGAYNILVGSEVDYPSDEEIDKMFGWAAHRYGFTDRLPLNHPYKINPPSY